MYDLAVAYRIYPKVSKPSHGLPFDDDKLRQSEICLRSLRSSLGSLRVKFWAIMDGCPPEYEEMFRRYFDAEDLVLIKLQGVGNGMTFSKQMDVLLQQEDADVVYFAEDDYLYVNSNFSMLIDFLKNGKEVQFVSAFDHPDDYFLDFHDFPKWVQVYKEMHWRNAASTCLTFLTTKANLEKYKSVFRSFEKRNYDTSLWVSLTKYRIFNPAILIRYMLRSSFLWKVLVKSWLNNPLQNLFGRRARLWIPMPSFALHLDRHHVAPGFDMPALILAEDQRQDQPMK